MQRDTVAKVRKVGERGGGDVQEGVGEEDG